MFLSLSLSAFRVGRLALGLFYYLPSFLLSSSVRWSLFDNSLLSRFGTMKKTDSFLRRSYVNPLTKLSTNPKSFFTFTRSLPTPSWQFLYVFVIRYREAMQMKNTTTTTLSSVFTLADACADGGHFARVVAEEVQPCSTRAFSE